MNRRGALIGSAAGLVTLCAARSGAVQEAAPTGRYDITLGVQPGMKSDEYVCRVALRSGESGRTHQAEASFKLGANATVRTGEGRPDGSAIDVSVDVAVDTSGQSAELVVTISDRGTLISVQRTSVQLPRA